MFERKREEVTVWTQLHKMELYNLSSITILLQVITTVHHIIFLGKFTLHIKNLIYRKLCKPIAKLVPCLSKV
jgi:hypothetical protein